MTRTIELIVRDEYMIGDGGVIGAMGAKGAVLLRMAFGEAWEGLSKAVTFRDALETEQATVSLLPAMQVEAEENEEESEIYLVSVPAAACRHEGVMTVSVTGTLTSGSTVAQRMKTSVGRFRVLPSFDEEDDESVDATLAEQLQAGIDALKPFFVEKKNEAEAAQAAAETAQGKAEDAQDAAEAAQSAAETAQSAAETAQGKAEDAEEAAEAAQAAAETAQGKAEDAQTAAETAESGAVAAKTAVLQALMNYLERFDLDGEGQDGKIVVLALNGKDIAVSEHGFGLLEGDVPVLGSGGKLPNDVLPPLAIGELITNSAGTKANLVNLSTAEKGDIAKVTAETGDNYNDNGVYFLTGAYSTLSNWVQIIGPSSVRSVAGKSGIVTLSISDIVGLADALAGKSSATNLKNGTGTGALKQQDANDYNKATGDQAAAFGASSIACPDTTLSDADMIADWEARENEKYQLAKGQHAFASGSNNLALGKNSHAEGNGTVASASAAHSEGTGSRATGKYSHAGGLESIASTTYAFAHGNQTEASGYSSAAFGAHTVASGDRSTAFGDHTVASGKESENKGASFAEGYYTTASGRSSHAEGRNTVASGNDTHAEGQGTTASASQAHAEGYNTLASGVEAHAEGSTTIASGKDAHAEGYKTRASGDFSHAGGWGDDSDDANQPYKKYVEATGNKSFAHGNKCKATGTSAIAMGDNAKATANYAVAFGNETQATNTAAVALGDHAVASGGYSAAVGPNTVAQNTRATAFGYGLQTNADGQAVYGKWNALSSDPIVFGNGSSSSARRNILTLSENNNDGVVFKTPGLDNKIKLVGSIRLRHDGDHGYDYLTSDTYDTFYIRATEKYGRIYIEGGEYGSVDLYGGSDGNINLDSGHGSYIYMDSDVRINTPYGGIYVNGQCISYGGCIVEGTMITMADGTKKAIEDVHTGDEVLSYDFENQQNVPAVVLFNDEHQRAVNTRLNLFDDGSTLNTWDEHYVYNVNGSACSDIRLWETKDAVLKQDGTVANWCGFFNTSDEAVRTFNLITSNNTYYANEILNSCWPSTKFRLAKIRGIQMPEELRNAVKAELGYHRHGTLKTNSADFLAAVKEIEAQCTLTAKSIEINKRKLANTDYQMIKTCEAVNEAIMEAKDFDDLKKRVSDIYSQEFTRKVNARKTARDAIKAVEEQSSTLFQQVEAIKQQYGVLTEFDSMSHREQFMFCNKLGCENLERYRGWDYIVKGRQIFRPKEQPVEEK